jgi:hypothetical protein
MPKENSYTPDSVDDHALRQLARAGDSNAMATLYAHYAGNNSPAQEHIGEIYSSEDLHQDIAETFVRFVLTEECSANEPLIDQAWRYERAQLPDIEANHTQGNGLNDEVLGYVADIVLQNNIRRDLDLPPLSTNEIGLLYDVETNPLACGPQENCAEYFQRAVRMTHDLRSLDELQDSELATQDRALERIEDQLAAQQWADSGLLRAALTSKQYDLLAKHFGLAGHSPHSLKQIAQQNRIVPNAAVHLYERAIDNLRETLSHPYAN